jgi:choline dehydrogenase
VEDVGMHQFDSGAEEAPTFDYVVVGGGSSGAVLAARLSENGRKQILLLEAGPDSHPLRFLPLSYALFLDHPRVNWRFRSEREPGLNGRRMGVPRGKMLGGSSAINGLVYVRGQPLDYDTWAQMGASGWAWSDVEPIFRRLENVSQSNGEARGRSGPLRISQVKTENSLYAALFAAAKAAGLSFNADYNGAAQEGASPVQATIHRGRRMSTAVAYLKAARRRANLTVITDATVERLTFEGLRCTGVAYRRHGRLQLARAGSEVILCAGAIGTPQILEWSGVGNPAVLGRAGIAVRHALHGVGENLREHLMAVMQWKLRRSGFSFNERTRGLAGALEVLRYGVGAGGFLAAPASSALIFLRTRPELETPDVQLTFGAMAVEDVRRLRLHGFPGVTMAMNPLRPQSRGSTHVRSANPADPPEIRFDVLSDPQDRTTMIDGFRAMRRIMDDPALDALRGEPVWPAPDPDSEDEILDYIRRTAVPAYHPIGACRMGPSPDCVVDSKLRVHGLSSLRIADGSIMPTMPSGNTNAACIMIGERAYDLVSEAW